MKLGRFNKTPVERKRYAIDYSQWLDTGETVSSFTLAASPTGMTVDGSSLDTTNTILTYFMSGGTDGQQYTLDVRITTSGGQIKEDTVLYTIRNAV